MQIVCLQDVVSVDQTDDNHLGLSLDYKVVALPNEIVELYPELNELYEDVCYRDESALLC